MMELYQVEIANPDLKLFIEHNTSFVKCVEEFKKNLILKSKKLCEIESDLDKIKNIFIKQIEKNFELKHYATQFNNSDGNVSFILFFSGVVDISLEITNSLHQAVYYAVEINNIKINNHKTRINNIEKERFDKSEYKIILRNSLKPAIKENEIKGYHRVAECICLNLEKEKSEEASIGFEIDYTNNTIEIKSLVSNIDSVCDYHIVKNKWYEIFDKHFELLQSYFNNNKYCFDDVLKECEEQDTTSFFATFRKQNELLGLRNIIKSSNIERNTLAKKLTRLYTL